MTEGLMTLNNEMKREECNIPPNSRECRIFCAKGVFIYFNTLSVSQIYFAGSIHEFTDLCSNETMQKIVRIKTAYLLALKISQY